LANYNEDVRVEAVRRESVENNNGVHGRNFWDVFIRFIRSGNFVIF